MFFKEQNSGNFADKERNKNEKGQENAEDKRTQNWREIRRQE